MGHQILDAPLCHWRVGRSCYYARGVPYPSPLVGHFDIGSCGVCTRDIQFVVWKISATTKVANSFEGLWDFEFGDYHGSLVLAPVRGRNDR